ncbi:MAG: hypothetical protein KAX84_09685 [Burkholderiales bacterium]|nr:hypothetical protein [Burkholderiales bacterium]
MNAIPFPFPRPVASEAGARAAAAVHADAHMGAALDILADAVGALYGQRRALTEPEHAALVSMRNAMVALSHARNLNEPNMVERRA